MIDRRQLERRTLRRPRLAIAGFGTLAILSCLVLGAADASGGQISDDLDSLIVGNERNRQRIQTIRYVATYQYHDHIARYRSGAADPAGRVPVARVSEGRLRVEQAGDNWSVVANRSEHHADNTDPHETESRAVSNDHYWASWIVGTSMAYRYDHAAPGQPLLAQRELRDGYRWPNVLAYGFGDGYRPLREIVLDPDYARHRWQVSRRIDDPEVFDVALVDGHDPDAGSILTMAIDRARGCLVTELTSFQDGVEESSITIEPRYLADADAWIPAGVRVQLALDPVRANGRVPSDADGDYAVTWRVDVRDPIANQSIPGDRFTFETLQVADGTHVTGRKADGSRELMTVRDGRQVAAEPGFAIREFDRIQEIQASSIDPGEPALVDDESVRPSSSSAWGETAASHDGTGLELADARDAIVVTAAAALSLLIALLLVKRRHADSPPPSPECDDTNHALDLVRHSEERT